MEIQLINGRFTIQEAEQLLSAIVKVKIAFHEEKIRTVYVNEEDIKHSEKRIKQLQEALRNAIVKLKEKKQDHTNINAYIELNLMPQFTQ